MIGVIFDLDGTLIDSAPDIHAVANDVMALEGLPPLTFDEVRSFIGNGVGVLVERVLKAHGVVQDAAMYKRVVGEFIERYEGAVTLTTLYPGVDSAIARLEAAGHPLGLCTNKPFAPTQSVLAHFGLGGAFRAVVGGDSLPQRKPHPAPLLHVIERLGTARVLYVGDSEVDAETAEAAGVPFALYTGGYRKTPVEDLPHQARFDHFDDLAAIVAAANAQA